MAPEENRKKEEEVDLLSSYVEKTLNELLASGIGISEIEDALQKLKKGEKQ